VSTAAEHEVQNLFKCLAVGFKYVVLLSPDEQTLVEARSRFGHQGDERVRYLTPDRFIDFLKEVEPTKPTIDGRPPDSGRPGKAPGSGSDGMQMLIAEDAAAYLGIGKQALAKMRLTGESPPFFKVGRRVLYDRDELDAWLKVRKRRSTSDPGVG
jgi:excisionase family DNA binding protein